MVKVFVNHVDSFTGKAFSRVSLISCIIVPFVIYRDDNSKLMFYHFVHLLTGIQWSRCWS